MHDKARFFAYGLRKPRLMEYNRRMSAVFSMRPPRRDDSSILLEGRNSGQVRPFLFGDHIITEDEHRRWLEKRLVSQRETPYFLLLMQDMPLGVAGLTHFDGEHNRGEWGFYIWAKDAPAGAGTAMLCAFLDELFLRRKLRKLCAQVLVSNERSLHLHRKLGFAEEGLLKEQVFKDGKPQDVMAFGLLERDWHERRGAFAAQIAHVNLTGE